MGNTWEHDLFLVRENISSPKFALGSPTRRDIDDSGGPEQLLALHPGDHRVGDGKEEVIGTNPLLAARGERNSMSSRSVSPSQPKIWFRLWIGLHDNGPL